MKITIKKIAEMAGVHPATVDKVLHNRPGVSDEVRQNVQKLIDELGYRPNPAGRVLQKQGRQYIIAAVLVQVDALPYLKKGIEKGVREQTGFDIEIRWYNTSFRDAQGQAVQIRRAVEEKADGIILSPISSGFVRDAINEAVEAGIPVVTTNSDIEGTRRLCFVGQNAHRASRVAGRLLGQLMGGKGSIGIISSAIASENNTYHVKEREQGFKNFIAENYPGIEIAACVESFEDPAITFRETERLLREQPKISGLYVTCGGVKEVGRAIRESGRKPDSLHVVSYEAYPGILALLEEDIVDCTIGSELEKQGEIPVQVIMDKLVLKKEPEQERVFTEIQILVKECIEE